MYFSYSESSIENNEPGKRKRIEENTQSKKVATSADSSNSRETILTRGSSSQTNEEPLDLSVRTESASSVTSLIVAPKVKRGRPAAVNK